MATVFECLLQYLSPSHFIDKTLLSSSPVLTERERKKESDLIYSNSKGQQLFMLICLLKLLFCGFVHKVYIILLLDTCSVVI